MTLTQCYLTNHGWGTPRRFTFGGPHGNDWRKRHYLCYTSYQKTWSQYLTTRCPSLLWLPVRCYGWRGGQSPNCFPWTLLHFLPFCTSQRHHWFTWSIFHSRLSMIWKSILLHLANGPRIWKMQDGWFQTMSRFGKLIWVWMKVLHAFVKCSLRTRVRIRTRGVVQGVEVHIHLVLQGIEGIFVWFCPYSHENSPWKNENSHGWL